MIIFYLGDAVYRELKRVLDSLSSTVKKESVAESFENIMTGLTDEVLPVLNDLIKDGNESFIKDNQFLKNMSKLTVRSKDNKAYLEAIKKLLNDISKEEKEISKLIEKELSDYVTSKGSTAKDLTIMKLVTDIGSLVFYVQDLNYYILVDQKDTAIPKVRLTDIRSNSGSFVNLFNAFHKDFSKYVKDISRVSEEIVNKPDATPSMMDALFKSRGKLLTLPASGFNGNPIYHIRMWLVDKEIERYELLKDKKKLIELKLLELKLEAANESNPKLKSQIEYYEEKISKLEYNIKEIEDDEESASDYIPVVF